MTRADVLKALRARLAEINRVLPPPWQRRAVLAAHEAADALLRRVQAEPRASRSWR